VILGLFAIEAVREILSVLVAESHY
jgi:hypothetical protein